MDHLPPVTDPAIDRTLVPYLGRGCNFDGGDFLTFPARQGWLIIRNESDTGAKLEHADGTEVSNEPLSAFLQAWLFFGLLQTFFEGVRMSYDHGDFVTNDTPGGCITTNKLPQYLERLHQIESKNGLEIQKLHLRRNLTLLHQAGTLVDEMLSFPQLSYSTETSAQQKLVIAESISILGETLMHGTKSIWRHLPDEIEQLEATRIRKKFRFAEVATLSIKRLDHLGWCKSDRMMMSRLVDTMGLAYAAQLKRLRVPDNHSRCSMYHCLEMQIDQQTYLSKHTMDGCTCSEVAVNVNDLATAIMSGKTPTVKIDIVHSGDVAKLEVQVTDSSERYVAFSHVWAHGLGNQAMNGLPECQLIRLQKLANNVCEKRNPGKTALLPAPFWIDTLCIPVWPARPEARNQAILNIKDTFSAASTILVLDAELQGVSIAASTLEKEMRLSICAWARRVWTLLEALIGGRENLWWQFKEEALSAAEVWSDDEASCTRISYRVSALDMRFPQLETQTDSAESLSTNFLKVMYALRYRSVSRVEDETLCIAPLVSLDRRELVATKDPTQRMKVFLTAWPAIPTYFLFFEGPRIEDEGYGWMPRSFIDGIHKSTALRADVRFTTFDASGLLVQHPGLIFAPPEAGQVNEYLVTGFRSPIDSKWYRLRDTGVIIESRLPLKQRWAYWYKSLHLVQRPALILEYPSNYADNYIIAVLVAIKEDRQDTLVARFLCRVWLDLVSPPTGGEEPPINATPLDQKWRVG